MARVYLGSQVNAINLKVAKSHSLAIGAISTLNQLMHILITGASSGIGHALAEALLARGEHVWAGARNLDSLQSLRDRYPERLHPLILDVTRTEDIHGAVKQLEAFSGVRELALINNAGIALGGPLEALPLNEWRDLFAVNVFGAIAMIQAFLPLLRRSRGRIVNIGSVSGLIALPFLSPYAASKFAVRAISDSLRRELLPFGIPVCLIEPGPIRTGIWDKNLQKSRKLADGLSPDMQTLYKEALEKTAAAVEKTKQAAVSPELVVEKVFHALYSSRPRPYYLVGKRIHLITALVAWVPTRILDRVLIRGFRFESGD